MIKKLLPLLLIIAVVLSSSGCMEFSTLATSQPMTVTTNDIDYVSSSAGQVGGKYWKIATAIDGRGESYYLELPASMLQDGDVQAQKYLKLYITPSTPYWHADCYDENSLQYAYKYQQFAGITMTYKGYGDVPYTRVSGVSQTIHTGYTAILEDEYGRTIAQNTYNVDDLNQGTLQMQAQDSDGFTRTIYITMDGMLPSGVLTPTGEFATLWDGVNSRTDSSYKFVNYLTLENKLDTWNNKQTSDLGEDWSDCYTWLASNGVSDLKSSSYIINYDIEGVGYTTGSHPTGLKLYYSTGTFKPLVTVYIPEQLAETIVEQKAAPAPDISEISNMEATEAGSVSWQVTVTNQGTAGDIKVDAETTDSSNGLQNIRTAGDSQIYIDRDNSYTWTFFADVADELTSTERDITVKVSANGGVGGQFGSTDYESFTVTVKNKDVSDDEKVTITVRPLYEETGDLFENGEVYVGFGSDAHKGSGEVSFEAIIGHEYSVYCADTADNVYKAQYNESNPYVFTPYQDKTVEILFNTERPESGGDFDLNTVLMGVIIVLVLVMIWQSGLLKILLQNPMLIGLIFLALVIIWAVGEVTGALESASQSVNEGFDSIKFWE